MTFNQKLEKFLSEKNFPPHCALHPCDGSYLRVNRGGKDTAWYTSFKSASTFYAKCGDWKTGELFELRMKLDGTEPSDADLEALKAKLRAIEEVQWKTSASLSSEEWKRLVDLGESGYLVNKKCGTSLHGCRIGEDGRGRFTAVPVRDVEETFWGFQKIYDDGSKSFPKQIKLSGNFHLIGQMPQYATDPVYLVEGLATGVSVYLAMKAPVIVVFSRVNISPVVRALKEKYKNIFITICADNDYKTLTPIKNPGLTDARAAAEKYSCALAIPTGIEGTDFNDMHDELGLPTVKQVIESVTRRPEEDLPVLERSDGKNKAPSEHEVVEAFLSYTEKTKNISFILSQERLFKWVGTHWEFVTKSEEASIKIILGKISGNKFSNSKMEACYRQFLVKVASESKGIDVYKGHVGKVNLTDGTLHLCETFVDGSPRLGVELRGHAKEDGMTYTLPFAYEDIKDAKNAKFDAFLRASLPVDYEENIKIIQEMFASALFPFFGRLFFIHGPSGTGKTTLIQLLKQILPEGILSASDPTTWRKEFYLESMLGKHVNICNDIDYHRPIEDRVAKSIVDGDAIFVNVKFESPIMGVLPQVHIFTCNGLPTTLEGANNVYLRRTSFIEMNTVVDPKDMDRLLLKKIMADGKEGIFNFAFQGLLRILENKGAFTETTKEKQDKQEWQEENDSFEVFIKAIKDKEVQGTLVSKRGAGEKTVPVHIDPEHPKLRIYRHYLFDLYLTWCRKFIPKDSEGRVSTTLYRKHAFYKKCGALFGAVNRGGYYVYKGIGFNMEEYDSF